MRTVSTVIHLIHRPQRRGAELFALDLVAHLPAELGGTVYSIYRGVEGASLDSDRLVRLDAGRGPVERLTGLDWSAYFALDRAVRAGRTRLIVAHGGSTLKYAGALAMTHRGCAVVYRCIGMPSYWARSPVAIRLNRVLLQQVDAVVCTSESSRRDARSHYGIDDDRLHVIPNGLDTRRYDVLGGSFSRAAMRRTLGIPEGAFVVVNVGSLTAEKGQADLIELVHGLRDGGLDAWLVIAGTGPLRAELEAAAVAAGVAPFMQLLGERTDVAEVLQASDVFVLPSRSEGMPAAVIEAGLSGLPVVAYAVGGVAEIIESGSDGIVVAPGDARALAAAVTRLVDDQSMRRRLGEEARSRWRERYDIRLVAGRYRDLFERVLARRVPVSRL